MAWWGVKVFASALSRIFIITSILSIAVAFLADQPWVLLPGICSITIFTIHIRRINRAVHSATGFSQAYGHDWHNRINPSQKRLFVSNPASWLLPKAPAFIHEQNIPFCSIPNSTRRLLCDIWQPAENAKRSGLAFVYFHGGAWGMLDKDFGTRPFFKHLVSQGHVIMDVAYRLFPETDMTGMVHDVNRSINWMKINAAEYQIDPEKVVIGGASAGGQLALLAAYSNESRFRPHELKGVDLSVSAVISAYAPTDLEALYYHTAQYLTPRNNPDNTNAKPAEMPSWIKKMIGKNFHCLGMDKDASAIGVLPVILGCHPDQCAEEYNAFSPITYVHENCPQTLILQGTHDIISPVDAARTLYEELKQAEVPVAMYLIPQTDHAFDLVLPEISPSAQTALYLTERFLALQANNIHRLKTKRCLRMTETFS